MALSGSIYTYFGPSGNHYKLQVDWSATQDIAGNTSTVTAQLKMWSDASWSMYTSQSKNGSIVIDGTSYAVSRSTGISTSGGSWINLGSAQSKTINHNSDGTGDFTLSGSYTFASVNINGTVVNTVSIPQSTFTLNTIPRATKATSAVSWTAGTQNLAITLSIASSSFHHTLELWVEEGGTSTYDKIGSRTSITSSSYTWAFTQAEITQMYTTNNVYENRPAYLRVYTYNSSGTLIGSYQDKTGTMYAIPTGTATLDNDNVFNIGATTLSTTINNFTTSNLSPNMFQYDLIFTLGSGSTAFTKTFPNVQTSPYNMTFTPADVTNMYAATPNSNSVSGTVRVRTKYNGVYTENGSPTSDVVNITGKVTGSTPVFSPTGLTYADSNVSVTAITNDPTYIIQNLSTVTVTIPAANRATASNGSTMSYYTATLGGVTSQKGTWSSTSSVTVTIGSVNLGSSANIVVTAYDSRGNSKSVNVAATILPYQPPIVTTSSKRSSGFDDNTTITLSGSTYSPLIINGASKNTLKAVTYAYKKTSDSQYPTGATAGAPTSFSYTTNNGIITVITPPVVALGNIYSWNTHVVIQDQFNTSFKDITVPVGTPILFLDATKQSVSVNQFPKGTNSFEVTGNMWFNGMTYVSQNIATMPATAGWYRVATSTIGVGNCFGEFDISCWVASYHSQTKFIAGIQYNNAIGATINVLGHSGYSSSAIGQVRIVYDSGVYSGQFAYLEVYLNPATQPTLQVRLNSAGTGSSGSYGWQLIDPTTTGNIPTGYTTETVTLDSGSSILHVVSTGTVSGSGTYIRYSNGTQVCYFNQSRGTTTASGLWSSAVAFPGTSDWYQSILMTWTFPATFASGTIPSCFGSGDFNGVYPEHHQCWARDETNAGHEHGVVWSSGMDTTTQPLLSYSLLAWGNWR